MVDANRALALLESVDSDGSTTAKKMEAWRSELLCSLEDLEQVVPADLADKAAHLRRELTQFAVRTSMVGQVKAGKTALTNALIGRPMLLPSDVNPWTSVVTSVHVNTPQPKGKDAVFTFFSTEEWTKMVEMGGHLGEMAVRANHREELIELTKQINAMQERTQERLGQNFNLLLDGYHSFLGATPEMVKKYVCLGDEEDPSGGRYADVTKSADLYLSNADFILPTVISDTPGVNDPFLLREAVTLENLSETDICVIVLSAHQAFSSVDVALLRILSALDNKRLVIFVNRIDELQDPDAQITEIDAYIRELLQEQNLPTDIPIVFGSADWATAAVTGAFETDHSLTQLEVFAEDRLTRLEGTNVSAIRDAADGSTVKTTSKLGDLSGMHELKAVIAEKSATNVAKPMLKRVQAQALDLTEQALLFLDQATNETMKVNPDHDFDAFFDELDTVLLDSDQTCAKVFDKLTDKVLYLMSDTFRDFIQTESRNLSRHLDAKKSIRDWKPDTDKLRRELNLAHDDYVGYAPGLLNQFFERVAGQIEVVYTMVLDDDGELFAVRAPNAPAPKTPSALMRTMAIDMNTGWLSDWFATRFKKDSYVSKFEEMCQSEMQSTLKQMRATYVGAYRGEIRKILHSFLQDHITTLQNLAFLGDQSGRSDALRKLGIDAQIKDRVAALKKIHTKLTADQGDQLTKAQNAQNRSVA